MRNFRRLMVLQACSGTTSSRSLTLGMSARRNLDRLRGLSKQMEDYEDEEKIEEGLFDLEDRLEEETDALMEILERMNNEMTTIGAETNKRATALRSITARTNERKLTAQERRKARAEVRQVLRGATGDMNRFTDNMEAELPMFQHHFEQFTDTSAKALPIYLGLSKDSSGLKETTHGLWRD